MKSIENVCIVGTGFMGWQIGLQCASSGFPIKLFDVSEEALKGALHYITKELDRRVGEKQITVGEKETVLCNIHSTGDMSEAASNVDLVIEAIPERLEIKRDVFKQLDQVCPSHTILATNSSSIRISKIEDATRRPDKVLNTHFYGNPWRSSIVELMRGTATSDGTIEQAKQFAIAIGMIPIIVQKESTGFVFNRVWRAIKRETLHLVDEGVASFEDVDRAWMCIYEASIGPFGMMDRVGLDVVRDIEMVYYCESGDERDTPPRLLIDKVERGELGVKTGKGFYTYPDPVFQNPSWLRARR